MAEMIFRKCFVENRDVAEDEEGNKNKVRDGEGEVEKT